MNGSTQGELASRARSEGGLLVVLCGLPASGKSSVASMLCPLIEAEWVSTDRTRERLFPLADVGKERKYSGEASSATYREVERRAAELLEQGRSVLVDGTYLEPAHRARPIQIAHDEDRSVLLIKVFAPDEVVRQRLSARTPGADAKSEADLAVYELMKSRLDTRVDGYLDLDDDEPIDPEGRPVPTASVDTWRGQLRARNVEPGSLIEAVLASLDTALSAR